MDETTRETKIGEICPDCNGSGCLHGAIYEPPDECEACYGTGKVHDDSSLDLFLCTVINCARCSQDHPNLRFKRSATQITGMTHWALCPVTGDPTLLKIEEVKDD